jgi:hypothetical protein
MQGITIKEHCLMFVWACLKEYVGSSWPILAIFLCGIVAGILLALFGKKKEAPLEVVDAKEYVPGQYEDTPLPDQSSVTWMFLSIVLFCAVTVMNPFLVRALIPRFGMTTVYYRFFWILPITFGAAYWLTRVVCCVRRKLIQAIVFAALVGAMAVVMPLNPGIANVRIPTNVYKVDGAVPVVCDAIHEDYEKTLIDTYGNSKTAIPKTTRPVTTLLSGNVISGDSSSDPVFMVNSPESSSSDFTPAI